MTRIAEKDREKSSSLTTRDLSAEPGTTTMYNVRELPTVLSRRPTAPAAGAEAATHNRVEIVGALSEAKVLKVHTRAVDGGQ